MQFWNWFFLATAVLTTAKPTEKVIDMSELPECMQPCLRQFTKHFDIERATVKKVCKKGSHLSFRYLIVEEFEPCLPYSCGIQPYNYKDMKVFYDWQNNICAGYRL